MAGALFMDLQKAFDFIMSINHSTLLGKNYIIYDCDNLVLKWFISYLSAHHHKMYAINIATRTPDVIKALGIHHCKCT